MEYLDFLCEKGGEAVVRVSIIRLPFAFHEFADQKTGAYQILRNKSLALFVNLIDRSQKKLIPNSSSKKELLSTYTDCMTMKSRASSRNHLFNYR